MLCACWVWLNAHSGSWWILVNPGYTRTERLTGLVVVGQRKLSGLAVLGQSG